MKAERAQTHHPVSTWTSRIPSGERCIGLCECAVLVRISTLLTQPDSDLDPCSNRNLLNWMGPRGSGSTANTFATLANTTRAE